MPPCPPQPPSPPVPPSPPLVAIVIAVLVTTPAALGISAVAAGATSTEPVRPNTTTCGLGSASTAASGHGSVSVSTWAAPASAEADLQSAADIRQGVESGLLTPAAAGLNPYEDELVAKGDVVVHRLQLNGSTTGLLDRIAAQDQGSPTANFRALVQQPNSGVEFRYLGPTACPPTLALNASIQNGSFGVVTDPDHDTLYFVLDTEHLRFEPPGGGEPTAEKWNWGHHMLSLTIRKSSGLVDENTSVDDHYELGDRHVVVGGEETALVHLDPAANQTVTGRGTMAPGTTFQIELVPLGDSTAGAAHTAIVTLDRNGTFTTTFDLSDTPAEAIYRIRVPSTPPAEPPHSLVVVGNATGASLTVEDQESIGTVLYASGITTTHGGFLVAQNETMTVAVSQYFGPGGASPQPDYEPFLAQNETLTVTVYRDSNGNHEFDPNTDEPYRVGGEVVQDTVNVTVDLSERETTTQTTSHPTTTSTSTTSTDPGTTTSTRTKTYTHSTTSTSASTPGFGAVLALVAIAIGGALVSRR